MSIPATGKLPQRPFQPRTATDDAPNATGQRLGQTHRWQQSLERLSTTLTLKVWKQNHLTHESPDFSPVHTLELGNTTFYGSWKSRLPAAGGKVGTHRFCSNPRLQSSPACEHQLSPAVTSPTAGVALWTGGPQAVPNQDTAREGTTLHASLQSGLEACTDRSRAHSEGV